jgi:hypothetical protein
MNSDQLNSLIRTVLKIIGGIFLQHGLADYANLVNSADVIGLVTLLAGIYLSHRAHATAPSTPPPPSGQSPIILCVLLAGLAASPLACSTSPQRASYQAAGATIISVDAVMTLWGDYVARNHPPASQEAAVKAAYEKYQASMAVACDAGAMYSAGDNVDDKAAAILSASLRQAIADASQDLLDLENLIQTFGVKLKL